MRIFAIDPGTEESAWVAWENGQLRRHGKQANAVLLQRLRGFPVDLGATLLAVEMIASYGMAVGREVFTTCVWIGRFIEAWPAGEHRLIYRRQVKLELCGSAKANDANIRAELLDRFGGKVAAIGSKKAPGPLYGLKGDTWAALGVAITTEKLLASANGASA